MIPGPVLMVAGVSLLLAFVISAALTPVCRGWAVKRGFVDRPKGEGHKEHERPIAFGGGISITAGILVPMGVLLAAAWVLGEPPADRLVFLDKWVPSWREWLGGVVKKAPVGLAIMAGAVVLHLVGLIDDHRPLSARVKLLIQVVVALAITAGVGVRSAEALGTLPAVLLTTFWIIAMTNAFNFMDNMDGLSAGVAVLTAVVLAVSSMVAGQVFVPCVLMLVAGGAAGFLIYNFPTATVFMGDAGSLVLGYMLAVCSVMTTFYDPEMGTTPFGVLVPVVVFAIPLYDMISVIIHRLRLGVSIFRGDRRHFSHRLVKRGLSPRTAVLTIYLATLATSLPAVLLPMHGWVAALLIVAQCLAVVAIIAILEATNGS